MNILSLIYSIPPPLHSPSTTYPSSVSTSTDSTRPSSPSSPSSSETSNHLSRDTSVTLHDAIDDRRFSQETAKYTGELFERDSPEGTPSSHFFMMFCNVVK